MYQIGVNSINSLAAMVQKDPGWTKFLTDFFGMILDYVFRFVDMFAPTNSLGFSIIIMTLIVRTIMLPLALKSQKAMMATQALQPQITKLKEKYPDTKDQEQQKKMNMEMQALYAENKVNPLGGCLPMFIQLPIFVALSYILNHACFFIAKLNEIYVRIGEYIFEIPNIGEYFTNFVIKKVPTNLMPASIVTTNDEEFQWVLKVLNKFRAEDWNEFLSLIPSEYVSTINEMLVEKGNIENFVGINLIETPNLLSIAIVIPLLTAFTTFLSSWIMMRQSSVTDEKARSQQKIMMYTMPIFMAWTTITFSVGIGIYWITSSVYQTVQQILIHKYYRKPAVVDEA